MTGLFLLCNGGLSLIRTWQDRSSNQQPIYMNMKFFIELPLSNGNNVFVDVYSIVAIAKHTVKSSAVYIQGVAAAFTVEISADDLVRRLKDFEVLKEMR